MRQLLKRLFLVGGLVMILLAASTVIFRYRDPDPYKKIPDRIAVANTGSSHGVHAFDWGLTGRSDTFSFANDSQSLYYDFQLVRHYIGHLEKGSTLLIPISYFSLYQSQYEPYEAFTERNELYYDLLDMDEIADVDKERFVMKNYLPALLFVPDKIREVFRETAADSAVRNPQKDQYTIQEIGALRAAYHYEGLKRENETIVKDQEALDSLKSLIELCQARQITPVIVTTPYMKYYNDGWNREFYDMFYEDIGILTDEYSIAYWDYSHDPDFQIREDYFIDTDHLSEAGAEIFLEKINEKIGNCHSQVTMAAFS